MYCLNRRCFLLTSLSWIPNFNKNDWVTWFTLHKDNEGNVASLREAVVVLIDVTMPDWRYSLMFKTDVNTDKIIEPITTCGMYDSQNISCVLKHVKKCHGNNGSFLTKNSRFLPKLLIPLKMIIFRINTYIYPEYLTEESVTIYVVPAM